MARTGSAHDAVGPGPWRGRGGDVRRGAQGAKRRPVFEEPAEKKARLAELHKSLTGASPPPPSQAETS